MITRKRGIILESGGSCFGLQRLNPALFLGRELKDAGGRHQREAGVGEAGASQHVLGTTWRLNLSVHRMTGLEAEARWGHVMQSCLDHGRDFRSYTQ